MPYIYNDRICFHLWHALTLQSYIQHLKKIKMKKHRQMENTQASRYNRKPINIMILKMGVACLGNGEMYVHLSWNSDQTEYLSLKFHVCMCVFSDV